jgi:predicted transcriptional regulator
MKKRKWLLLVSVIAIAIFLIIFYFNIYEVAETTQIRNELRPRPFPMLGPIEYRLWLSPIVLIIAIVPISYYFISKKLERNMKIVLNLINKNNFKTNKDSTEINNKNTILKLLNFNERKVLEMLIEKKGEILQSEISRIKGMNKLKAHRAIRNLELRGVIETENYGKTKHIILSKDIKNIMLK